MEKITKRSALSFKLGFFILFLLLNKSINYGQERSELEQKKVQNLEKLKVTQELLDRTKEEKMSSIQNIQLINKSIEYRNQLINNIEDEVNQLDIRIRHIRSDINRNDNQIETLKEEYGRIIRKSYRNIEEEYLLMYLFSSEDINQAYQRIKYIKYLNEYRRNTVDQIQSLNDSLFNLRENLRNILETKRERLSSFEQEKKNLMISKGKRRQVLNELMKNEQKLLNEIEERKKIQERVESEIRALIREEAEEARASNRLNALTPEERIISDQFYENKGRLPWPTERGVITGNFGEHNHPVLKGIKVKRNVIDISASPVSYARAVFDGEITKVISILGTNYTVIIKHGNFRTVYQNLIDVNVKTGDRVTTKQRIGRVAGNDDSEGLIHFELWKETEILNPEIWISR